jgi:hypothetical protein
MKRIGTIGIALSALVIAGSAALPSAVAAPMGGTASDTVRWLEDHGYHVQLNGNTGQGGLNGCTTTGVHGLRGDHADDAGRPLDDKFHTVHVDISCNNTR